MAIVSPQTWERTLLPLAYENATNAAIAAAYPAQKQPAKAEVPFSSVYRNQIHIWHFSIEKLYQI